MAVRKLDPAGARRFAHFSQAVLVEVPGPTLYVAGQGDVTGDFEIHSRKAWTQIEVLLKEAGMTLADVVKVTGYVVDRNYVSAYRAVFLEVMGEVRPSVHARHLRFGAPGDAGRDRNCSDEELEKEKAEEFGHGRPHFNLHT